MLSFRFQDTTARILTLLRILRSTRLNSTLPVQVFHFKGEITADNEREEIRKLGGELFEFEGEEKEVGVWKNFREFETTLAWVLSSVRAHIFFLSLFPCTEIKALAILQSTFSVVLYLDSVSSPSFPFHSHLDAFLPALTLSLPSPPLSLAGQPPSLRSIPTLRQSSLHRWRSSSLLA